MIYKYLSTRKRRAMALPIVLIFAVIMSFVSIYLLKNTRDTNTQIQTGFEQLQSYFIARAGVEHVALKVKYLNNELYDAFCMYQGRNPLFNYSLIKNIKSPWDPISQYNPGPIFLYKNDGDYPRNDIFSDMKNKNGYDNWVNTFRSDLVSRASLNPNTGNGKNTVLDIIDHMPSCMNTALTTKPNGNRMFKQAYYQLTDIGVSANQVVKTGANRIENNMIIEFTIKSVYQSNKSEQNFDYEIKRTMLVKREL